MTPRATDHGSHSWHLYILQLNLAALKHGRDEVVKLLRERGIHTSVHFIPLHLHPAYQKAFGYRAGAFPAAEGIFEGAVSLPIYPDMTDEDVAYVTDVVRDTLAACRR